MLKCVVALVKWSTGQASALHVQGIFIKAVWRIPPLPLPPRFLFSKTTVLHYKGNALEKKHGTPDCNLLSFSLSQGKASFEEGHYLICGHVPHNVQFPQISPKLLYLFFIGKTQSLWARGNHPNPPTRGE